jgi:hypothetical protein
MHMPGDYDVRSKEAVFVNRSVMADVISTPQRDIVTDTNKWLNGVVL